MATDLHEPEVTEQKVSDPHKTNSSPLEKAIQFVRRDCRQSSDKYLDETTVPHGGE